MAEYICKNGVLRPITGIYQCVDRLVEGVDYERYDWLKGDGVAWIDTTYKPNNDSGASVVFKANFDEIGDDYVVFGLRTGYVRNYIGCTRSATNEYKIYAMTSALAKQWIGNYKKSVAYKVLFNYLNDRYKTCVGQESNRLAYEWDDSHDKTWYLFAANYSSKYQGLFDVSKCEITDRDYIKKTLTPCQLLRSISAQLSSDNKPHPSGECGMVDSVSGKFYGNANTSGSFSVYND